VRLQTIIISSFMAVCADITRADTGIGQL